MPSSHHLALAAACSCLPTYYPPIVVFAGTFVPGLPTYAITLSSGSLKIELPRVVIAKETGDCRMTIHINRGDGAPVMKYKVKNSYSDVQQVVWFKAPCEGCETGKLISSDHRNPKASKSSTDSITSKQ